MSKDKLVLQDAVLGRSPQIALSHEFANTGIEITYVKKRKMLWISGWYDNVCGIEGTEMPLQEFIDKLQLPVEIKG